MGYSETEGIQRFDETPLKCIAIITARGGSKGLTKKNIRLLDGKPLIAHTILAALNCPYVERCIVSTEDAEIRQISLNWGAEVIDRPVELASDYSLSKDVVKHVIDTLGEEQQPRYFVLLQPTSPLRNSNHLTECIERFVEAGNAKSGVSVTEAYNHPYKTFAIENQELKPFFNEELLDQPRQKLPKAYTHNGAIYLTGTSDFLINDSLFTSPVMAYVMSQEDSVDIDTQLDLIIAENILNNAKNGGGTTDD